MKRSIWLLAALCCASPAFAQAPIGPLAVTDGVGPTRVVLDRYDDPPPQHYTVVSIITYSGALSISHVAQAIDRLLARTEARKPLQAEFTVRFGAVREALEAGLRDWLRQPGANWNLSTGQPRHGSYYPVLQSSLASVIAASPIADAFRRHGYGLRLDGVARATENVPPRNTTHHLPGHIDEMDITAFKGVRR